MSENIFSVDFRDYDSGLLSMEAVCSRISDPFQYVLVGCGLRATLSSNSKWGRI